MIVHVVAGMIVKKIKVKIYYVHFFFALPLKLSLIFIPSRNILYLQKFLARERVTGKSIGRRLFRTFAQINMYI